MRDVIEFILTILALIIGTFSIIALFILIFSNLECKNVGEVYNKETKFYAVGGCFVKLDNEFLSLRAYENRFKNGENLYIGEKK